MSWPITRLQEAIVDKFDQDPELISLTNEGQLDSVGTIHHIGIVLNEPAMKDRLPYVGFQVVTSQPLIPNEGRIQIEQAIVLAYVYSKDEFMATKIADRIHMLLISPDDSCCNGYYDITNAHIRNFGTEYAGRAVRAFMDDSDVYVEVVEISMIWSPVPCDCVILDPYSPACPDPVITSEEFYCYEDCYYF